VRRSKWLSTNSTSTTECGAKPGRPGRRRAGHLRNINQDAVALNGAVANYQALVAQGNRIQQERLTFRQHVAAQVQGDTVANAAFLIFQNEDLERYTTLFHLAAEYACLAANAYDYETGLLNTPPPGLPQPDHQFLRAGRDSKRRAPNLRHGHGRSRLATPWPS